MPAMREPNEIRADCTRELAAVKVSGMFKAVLACLLDQGWSRPQLTGLHYSGHSAESRRLLRQIQSDRKNSYLPCDVTRETRDTVDDGTLAPGFNHQRGGQCRNAITITTSS